MVPMKELMEISQSWYSRDGQARRAYISEAAVGCHGCGRQKQEMDRALAEADRQEDNRMLAAALQAAAEADAREAAAKAAVREQELRFRQHLEAAMQHEAQVCHWIPIQLATSMNLMRMLPLVHTH